MRSCEREKVLALKQVHEMRMEKEKAEYLLQESERTCTKLSHECERLEREMHNMQTEYEGLRNTTDQVCVYVYWFVCVCVRRAVCWLVCARLCLVCVRVGVCGCEWRDHVSPDPLSLRVPTPLQVHIRRVSQTAR